LREKFTMIFLGPLANSIYENLPGYPNSANSCARQAFSKAGDYSVSRA
jgi:hypothetical protein